MPSDKPKESDKSTPKVDIPPAPRVPEITTKIESISEVTGNAANTIPEDTEEAIWALKSEREALISEVEVFKGTPILILVDDFVGIRRVNKRHFRLLGLTKTLDYPSAEDALAAIEKMESEGTLEDNGLIVCDNEMGGIPGSELAETLQKTGLKTRKAITFVIHTSCPKKDFVEQIKNGAIDVYIFKTDLTKDRTTTVIAEALARNRKKKDL